MGKCDKMPGVNEFPIVSLENLTFSDFESNRKDWESAARAFDHALRTGYCYLANHGISQEKVQKVFEESVNFFKLPEPVKMAFERDFEKTFHGYTQIGGELMTNDVSIELREMFDAAVADNEEFSKCQYPDKAVPEFKPAMKDLMKECRTVTKILLKLLGLSVQLQDEDYFLNCHHNVDDPSIPNFTQLRTLFYPSVKDCVDKDAIRCAAHTDYGTFTLLFEGDVGGGGLQIKSPHNGSWISANPIPGCIFVNVGDMLQLWSGGIYPSTVHQVVIPEDEICRKTPRQSIALFVKPDNNTIVTPLKRECHPDLKSENGVNAGDHFRARSVHHRLLANTD